MILLFGVHFFGGGGCGKSRCGSKKLTPGAQAPAQFLRPNGTSETRALPARREVRVFPQPLQPCRNCRKINRDRVGILTSYLPSGSTSNHPSDLFHHIFLVPPSQTPNRNRGIIPREWNIENCARLQRRAEHPPPRFFGGSLKS